ncbi:hypothetical protein [Streptomyces zaomyceticus]|uniref:hypothetical protein n=1 Tax=Streptomyces zaomyceticus TaxID=68286 RepID=UPI00341DE507
MTEPNDAGLTSGVLARRLSALYDRTVPVVLAWQGGVREAFVDEPDCCDRQLEDLQAAQDLRW